MMTKCYKMKLSGSIFTCKWLFRVFIASNTERRRQYTAVDVQNRLRS